MVTPGTESDSQGDRRSDAVDTAVVQGRAAAERPPAVRFFAACLVAGAALAVRLALNPAFGDGFPYITLFPAVVVAAWVGGFWPGVLAGTLGAIGTHYMLLADRSGTVSAVAEALGTVMFLLSTVIISLVCESLQRTRRTAELSSAVAAQRSRQLEGEVEKRMKAQADARTGADAMYRIVESVGDAVIAVDTGWNIVLANSTATSMLGPTDSAAPDVWTRFPAVAGTVFEEHSRAAMAAGMPTEFEWTNPLGNRIEARAYPTPAGLTLVCRDVTEQRRTQEALRASQRFSEQVAAAMPSVLYVFDIPSRQVVYSNRALADVLGYPPDELPALQADLFREIVHPDDIAATPEHIARLVQSEEGQYVERQYRVRRRDGEWRWLRSRETAFQKDSDGRLTQILGVAQDVTASRLAEEAIRASDERYRAFVARSSEAIWRFELDETIPTSLPIEEQIDLAYRWGYLAECNDQMARMYGFGCAEEIVGARLPDLMPAEDPANRDYLTAFIANGYRLDDAESHELDRDGNDKYFLNNLVGIVEDGCLTRAWGTQRDITERKQADARLQEALQKLDFHVTNSPLALIEWDRDLRVTRWSANAERMAGYPAPEMLGRSVERIVHEEDAQPFHAFVESLSVGSAPRGTITTRVRRADGEVRWCEWYASCLIDGSGQVASALALLHDITTEQHAMQALHESDERLRIAMEAAHMGAWEWDIDADTLTLSEPLYRILMWEGERPMTPADLLARIHPEDRARVEKAVDEDLATGDDHEIEYRVVLPTGEVRWIAARGRTTYASDGRATRMVGVAHDVTEQKEHETEIRRLNSDLERRVEQRTRELRAANEELESFCYSVSHDLRGPLRSIMGYSMIMQEDYSERLDEDARMHLTRMSDAARKLAQLIDDLLELSRLTRSELRRMPVDISEIAQDVEAELRARGATGEVVIEPGMKAEADPRLLRVALMNLIENAHKFSSRRANPRIEIGMVSNGKRPSFYVRDNGVGFNMQYVNKIYDPFQRLHRDSEYPGTGIGLANVKRIIERHGGDLWAESSEDAGATFYFTL